MSPIDSPNSVDRLLSYLWEPGEKKEAVEQDSIDHSPDSHCKRLSSTAFEKALELISQDLSKLNNLTYHSGNLQKLKTLKTTIETNIKSYPEQHASRKHIDQIKRNIFDKIDHLLDSDKVNQEGFKGKITHDPLNPDLRSKKSDQPILKDFLDKYQSKFLAHAMRNMSKEVLCDGVLKPAEMIYREKKSVDYEAGLSIDTRYFRRLPYLSENEVKDLQDALFDAKDAKKLEELKAESEEIQAGKEIYQKFSKLRYAIQYGDLDDDVYTKTMKEAKILLAKIKEDPQVLKYLQFHELRRLSSGLRAFFILKNKLALSSTRAFESQPSLFMEIAKKLTIKYGCEIRDILIAFDERQPTHKKIDTYFKRKRNIKYDSHMLYDLRINILRNQKLNPEIRMSQATIFWQYGDVVILKGEGEKHIVNKLGSEAVMHSPHHTPDGEFFVIDLQEEDVLILGPRAKLEPFQEKYKDKLVFIEDLSIEQLDKLKVPQYLRKELKLT